MDAPRFPPILIPLADLKIESRKPPVPGAWLSLTVTHVPTKFAVASVRLSREELVNLLGLVPVVQDYYADR